MEENLRQELLAQTRQALDADDWEAVVRIWQPWVEKGDPEAEYQLAYHYFWFRPVDDEAMRGRMKELLRAAAAKDHPDAIWFLATREFDEMDPEFERELLRAGRLGGVHAQRSLGVAYATGEWSGPKDPAEAVRWYRLAAQQGQAESMYDLGFMMLLGQGGAKNIEEGLRWVERAGELGEYNAWRLLADCYESGFCGVPVDADKAQVWRGRMEEYERTNPPSPSSPSRLSSPCRRYTIAGATAADLEACRVDTLLMDIEGVTGWGFGTRVGGGELSVYYDPAVITAAVLDERIGAVAGLAVVPVD